MRVGMVMGYGGILSLLWMGAARAQEKPSQPDPSVFSRLFTQPTGQNGYEDWVQAGDLVRDTKLVDQAAETNATLTFKRRVLDDPAVQKALHLLREGLNKPAQSPHNVLDENTTYPEFGPLRRLGGLLATEIYVRFANGSVDGAIDTLNDGLCFGYRIQSGAWIGGLSGIVVQEAVLQEFSAHLDQLSQYQCNRVQRLIEEVVAWPSPATTIINNYRASQLHRLEAIRSDPKALQTLFKELTEEETDPLAPSLLRSLNNPFTSIGQIFDRAEALLNGYLIGVLANRKLPIQERKFVRPIKDDLPGGRLCAVFLPDLERFTGHYDRLEAELRLLGVHAAIRGYRWEHSSLPASLTDLHLGTLIVDPFTGNSLMYRRSGETYDLSSRGPFERDDNGQPTSASPPPLNLRASD